MRILSWNVNGLRSAYQKGFHQLLNVENPDIVCLQETKMQESQFSALTELTSFGHWYFSSAEKKGYSGVAIGVNNKLHGTLILEGNGIGLSEFDSEGRFLIMRHPSFVLYNIYFPSGTSGEERQQFKYRFLDAFASHIESLPAEDRKRLVVCGDFNICHREIDIHHPEKATKLGLTGFLPEERKWMDRFCDLGFVDTFRHVHGDITQQYSWWSFRAGSRKKNLGWRIDYIFTSQELAPHATSAALRQNVLGSDHCPALLELEL
jgi:exodeoxyribonuclease-3